jgi:hypothetical protein
MVSCAETGEWISADYMLPVMGELVLVSFPFGGGLFRRVERPCSQKGWVWELGGVLVDHVELPKPNTYWRPLPENPPSSGAGDR